MRLLPGVSVQEVIATRPTMALESGCCICFQRVPIYLRWYGCLAAPQAAVMVRLGDGELLTMAQGIQSLEQLRKDGPFLPYAA